MYKHVHRVFQILSKNICKSAVLSTAGFLNSNVFMDNTAATNVLLKSLSFNLTKRYCSVSRCDSDEKLNEESDDESYEENEHNPSVEVQKKIQQDAQVKLDDMLAKNPELNKFYKLIELEIEVMRQSGNNIPDHIKPTDWLHLLESKSQSSRRKLLEFIFINEVRKKKDKKKREESVLMRRALDRGSYDERDRTQYGLRNNTMFTRIYKSTMSEVLNKKLITAIMFGEKLVIDCGFESHMSYRELSSCAKQLMFSFVTNREANDPYDIYLCNLDLNGELYRRLLSFFPTMNDPGYPLNVSSKSYLELFPKENLVYLSPHASNVMSSYNPDTVYIIGGIVDKVNCKPLTIAKAKEEKIRTAKFPLDGYLSWKAGSGKNLSINNCVNIMVDIKQTKDWEYALRSVPSRKVVKPYMEYETGPKVARTFQNVAPKFQSSQASQVPDVSYYNRWS